LLHDDENSAPESASAAHKISAVILLFVFFALLAISVKNSPFLSLFLCFGRSFYQERLLYKAAPLRK
jgi:hypothetical protein